MKTYREVRRDMAPAGPSASDELLECEVCHVHAPRETLSNFGGRCGKCFTAYCRGAFSGPVRQVSRAEAAQMLERFKAQ